MSRDDSGSFLPPSTEAEIVKKNPFASIDQTGVGRGPGGAPFRQASRPPYPIKIAAEKGNATRWAGPRDHTPLALPSAHRKGEEFLEASLTDTGRFRGRTED